MEIKTKFEVNQLVKHKYDTIAEPSAFIGKEHTQLLEVLQIKTETCSAGTQVFYLVRAIAIMQEKNHVRNKETDKVEEVIRTVIGHGVPKNQGELAWYNYREDELIEAPQELIDLIKNAQKK